jgi:hypothetical protein
VSRLALPFFLLALAACGPDGVDEGTYVSFDPDGELSGRRAFFDFPWPADVRRLDDGTLDLELWPASTSQRFLDFRAAAKGKAGFPTLPVAYFRFNAPLAARESLEPIPNAASSPILLVELDGASGRLLPTIAVTPKPDAFTPENLLAVAPRPGVVLRENRTHAFVVLRALNDAAGQKLGVPSMLAKLMQGQSPNGVRSAKLLGQYQPLFQALEGLGVQRTEIAAATVFTTGDAVAETHALTEQARAVYAPTIEVLGLEANPRLDTAPYCHVLARLALPQFQRGAPIFDSEGLFTPTADGSLPPKLRDETALVSLTLPRRAMPAGGYPLVVYFHGSGGSAREFVDGADTGPTASPIEVWPANVLGLRGFAMAGMSLPISPDRVPGASDFAYLNFGNPVAVRDTFRQGIIESRLFFDALERVRIPASALIGCSGPTLPLGEPSFRFSFERLSVQGQSMGGMYANLVSAVEPRIQAVVPTGAGGLWTSFVLTTPRIPTNEVFLGQLVGTSVTPLTHLNPAFQLIQLVLEPIDPLVSTPRLSRRPLPGHPARPVYQPVSTRDSYFPIAIYDAMVLGYGNPLAGEEVWPGVRDALASVGADPTASYPVRNNLTSEEGVAYTGVAVQHSNDGGFDGHGVYRRLDSVKWQYGCFHQTFHETGVAVVPPPESIGGACP